MIDAASQRLLNNIFVGKIDMRIFEAFPGWSNIRSSFTKTIDAGGGEMGEGCTLRSM